MIMKSQFVWLLCGLALLGCSGEPKPAAEIPVPVAKAETPEPVTETTADGEKSEPYEASVGGFNFRVPADWKEQPPKSQFVLGEFSIPGEGGPARLTISSAGGGIEANIERWRGQFTREAGDPEPRETEILFGLQKGTLVELAGTYTDMFSGGKPNQVWRMLGVAVPMGPTNVFVKMTGPAATVVQRRDEFVKFVESARGEK